MKRDVTLDPGWTITGVVLGPDGQPLAGAFGMGIGQLKTAEFTMRGFSPRESRELLFPHQAKGLIGLAPPPGTDGSSITVKLQPGAAVAGRLVDADGRPQSRCLAERAVRPERGTGPGRPIIGTPAPTSGRIARAGSASRPCRPVTRSRSGSATASRCWTATASAGARRRNSATYG